MTWLKAELIPCLVLPFFFGGIYYSVFQNYPLESGDWVAFGFGTVLFFGWISALINYIETLKS